MVIALKNKRAWIRIVEAVFAIMLLAGFLAFVVVKQQNSTNFDEYARTVAHTILRDISVNDTLRGKVLQVDKESVEDFVENQVPTVFSFSINICNVDEIFGIPEYPGDVEIYSDDILITASISPEYTEYSPKVLKIFLWKK